MMQDPAFQAYVDKVTKSAAFQQSMSKAQEAMKDPEKVKEMEEKAAQAIKDGNKQLEELEQQKKEAPKEKAENKDDADQKSTENVTETEEEGKPPAVDDEDDIPDIPTLSLN